MGPNGSGADAVPAAIAGHPKYLHVTSGTITLDGADVLAMSIDERARPACFYAISRRGARCLDVELPALGGNRHGEPRRNCGTGSKEVKAAMAALDIDPASPSAASTRGFSGGERKRHGDPVLELPGPRSSS